MSKLKELLTASSVARNESFDPADRPALRDFLLETWNEAVSDIISSSVDQNIGSSVGTRWFDRLWELHTESSRHYHTAVHLEEMIQYFQQLREEGYSLSLREATTVLSEEEHDAPTVVTNINQESVVILLSIFFHDAIYNAASNSNEEDSAKLFEDFAKEMGMTDEVTKKVSDFILATKSHKVEEKGNDDLLAIFLDLDMAVLGKKEDAYQSYAGLIRREYSFVPHDVYCEKRADILQAFLQQEWIYGSMVMRDAFEAQARSNIRNEIESLKLCVIPGSEI